MRIETGENRWLALARLLATSATIDGAVEFFQVEEDYGKNGGKLICQRDAFSLRFNFFSS